MKFWNKSFRKCQKRAMFCPFFFLFVIAFVICYEIFWYKFVFISTWWDGYENKGNVYD